MKPLCQIIRHKIATGGALSFARFMELALYCPEYGYYEQQKDNVGARGDFYTSVSTGELFGQLLAFQFAAWLEEIKILNPRLSTLTLLEAGAHDGKLAQDILAWLRSNRPGLFSEIEYLILEPSARRREWQQQTLRDFPNVRWAANFGNLSLITRHSSLNGVIFSNELLDAMPVHRFGWDAAQKTWFEWGVALDGEKFIWAKIPDSQSAIHNPQLESVLPDGYTIETSPAAADWWRTAAGMLAHGKLMAIDYGFTADELFSPVRTRGTLRAYHRHHVTDDLLANPGEQDLTAHVNFSAIQTVGEAAGLKTGQFTTQTRFLTEILGNAIKDKIFGGPGAPKSDAGGWNARRTRQFQTLTHPEHLGRAFRVLVQSK